jgi:cobalt-zinc-cadmium efflux system protein
MHVHANPGNGKMQRVLQISLVVTSAYVLATLLYGLRAHSLALVSEAGHNASDALALLLSFVAVKLEARPANDTKTFGYRRAGVLAAFLNALTLILISVWIAWLAVGRLLAPVTVQPRIMMVVAALGVVMNGVIAAMLSRQSHDVNIRGAFLHMLGDTLSTAAVIAGGAVILWTGVQWVDPVLSLLIAGIIAWSAWGIMHETLNILLEGAPRGIDLAQVRASIRGVEGVCEVHDLHVWSIGSNWHALASHISVGEQSMEQMEQIQEEIRRTLRDGFQITHTTLQMEREGCGATDHGCSGPPSEFAVHAHHGHSH